MRNKVYAEIIVRGRGPEGWRALTLEVQFPYNPDLSKTLSEELPKGSRLWDGDGDKQWHVHPSVKEELVEILYRFYDTVYFTEGAATHEIRSGFKLPEQRSFLC